MKLNRYGAKNPWASPQRVEKDGEEEGEAQRRERKIEEDRWERIQQSKREERDRMQSNSQPQHQHQPPVEPRLHEPTVPDDVYKPQVPSGTSVRQASSVTSGSSGKSQRKGRGDRKGKGKARVRSPLADAKEKASADAKEKEEKRLKNKQRHERRKRQLIDGRDEQEAKPPAHALTPITPEFMEIPLAPIKPSALSPGPIPSQIPHAISPGFRPSMIPLPSGMITPRTQLHLLDPHPSKISSSTLRQRAKIDFIHNNIPAKYGDGYLSRMLVMCGGDEREVVRRLGTGDIPNAMKDADPMMPLDEHGRFSLEDSRPRAP